MVGPMAEKSVWILFPVFESIIKFFDFWVMSYRNWKHILGIFSFHNSVFHGIFVIKHTPRDPLAATFDSLSFFFSFFFFLSFPLFFLLSLFFNLVFISFFSSFSPFSSQFVLSFFSFLFTFPISVCSFFSFPILFFSSFLPFSYQKHRNTNPQTCSPWV